MTHGFRAIPLVVLLSGAGAALAQTSPTPVRPPTGTNELWLSNKPEKKTLSVPARPQFGGGDSIAPVDRSGRPKQDFMPAVAPRL